MKLNSIQKVQAAFSAVRYMNELKHLLIRRYWQNRKNMKIEIDGVTALIDTSDFLSNTLFWCSEYPEGYEPSVCEILARLIKNSKVYADVGGNVGVFSILPAILNPDCKIFYFEMDRTIKPLLIRNMRLNKLDEARITIVNAAAGDHVGELEYLPHPYSFLAKLSRENIDVYDIKYHAPVIRLDDYFLQQGADPDLLKIDIDGAEMMALRGMSRILKETKPDLLLEVHPAILPRVGSSASEVCDFLRGFDYLFFLIPTSATGDMIFVTARRRRSIVANTLELSSLE